MLLSSHKGDITVACHVTAMVTQRRVDAKNSAKNRPTCQFTHRMQEAAKNYEEKYKIPMHLDGLKILTSDFNTE